MKSNYDLILYILKKWPTTPSRPTRDYAFRFRELINARGANGNIFEGTTEENTKKLESLHRIVDDVYIKKYPCNIQVGATGLPLKFLNEALDDEFIKKFNKKRFPFFK